MGNAMHGLLGEKVFASIGHLPGSRLGSGDHALGPGPARAFTDIACWQGTSERIVITEKLDGTCVSVIRDNDDLIPALRSGHRANTSPYEQHHRFEAYVAQRWDVFFSLLQPGERVVGEWMAQAHGIKYDRLTDLFFAFDIRCCKEWLPTLAVRQRCAKAGINTVPLLYYGPPLSLEHVQRLTNRSAFRSKGHAEGAVLRRELGRSRIDIAKYVRHDHAPGIYLPETDNAVVAEPVWHEVK